MSFNINDNYDPRVLPGSDYITAGTVIKFPEGGLDMWGNSFGAGSYEFAMACEFYGPNGVEMAACFTGVEGDETASVGFAMTAAQFHSSDAIVF